MLKRTSRRMMKGLSAEESMKTYLEVLLFIGTITAVLIAISTYIVSFDSVLADTSKRLDAIDITYMMDGCLRGDEHYIDAAMLDDKRDSRENVIRTCGIMRSKLGIEIKDLEDSGILGTGILKKEWDFRYADLSVSPHKHSIFVNIGVDEDIHVGKLTSKVMMIGVIA